MPQVTYIEPDGREVEIDVPEGWTLMQSAMTNGVSGIEAECGGSCSCATCHCYVEGDAAESLPGVEDKEAALLEFVVAERKPNSRLSCQIRMTPKLAGLRVRLPDIQS